MNYFNRRIKHTVRQLIFCTNKEFICSLQFKLLAIVLFYLHLF